MPYPSAARSSTDTHGVSTQRHGARLSTTSCPAQPTAAVLVFHGGAADSTAPVSRFSPAVLRLIPVARAIARAEPSVAVYRLRFGVRGWNGLGTDVLADAHQALADIAGRTNARLREAFVNVPADLAPLAAKYRYLVVDMQAAVFPGELTDIYRAAPPLLVVPHGSDAWYLADLLEHDPVVARVRAAGISQYRVVFRHPVVVA